MSNVGVRVIKFRFFVKWWGADYKISQYNIFGYQNLSVSRSIKVYVFWSFQSFCNRILCQPKTIRFLQKRRYFRSVKVKTRRASGIIHPYMTVEPIETPTEPDFQADLAHNLRRMNTLSKCVKDIMQFTGNFTCEYIRLSITSDKQSINFKIYCFCLFSRLRFFCIREEFFRLLFWNILKSATNRRSRIPARYKKSSNSSQANSEIFRFSYSLHSRWPFFLYTIRIVL